jgi:hypothetical protein
MRLLALSAATAIGTTISFCVSAADIGYPAAVIGHGEYGVAPRGVVPPQVIILPAPHQYNGAVPPRGVGYFPNGVAPLVTPRADVVPRASCPPVWRCGDRGCDWQPGCAPLPEHYSGGYGPPDPEVYPGPSIPPPPEPYSAPYAPSPRPEHYSGEYGPPDPQVYSRPGIAAPETYSGPYEPSPRPEHYSGRYGPPDARVYPRPGIPAPEPYAPSPRPEHYSGGGYGPPDPQVYSRPPALDPYAPQVYLGPDGSYSGGQSSTARNRLAR